MDFLSVMDLVFPLKDTAIAVVDWTLGAGIASLHVLLSTHIKEGGRACVVSVDQTWAHFRNIGSKLGCDLSAARESGKLIFRDFLTEHAETTISENAAALPSLYAWFQTQTRTDGLSLIVINDLSTLLLEGYSVTEMQQFCHSLSKLPCAKLFGMHNSSSPEDVKLRGQLNVISNVVIETKPMQSGESNEIDGWVTLRLTNEKHEFHFAANQRGVLLMPPGTTTAVL